MYEFSQDGICFNKITHLEGLFRNSTQSFVLSCLYYPPLCGSLGAELYGLKYMLHHIGWWNAANRAAMKVGHRQRTLAFGATSILAESCIHALKQIEPGDLYPILVFYFFLQ